MRLVSIPEAHNSVEEAIPCIKGTLTWLSRYSEWDGKGQVKGKQSVQFGKLEDSEGKHIRIKFVSLLGPVNQNLLRKAIVFQCDKGKRGLTGVKVRIHENEDGTKETVLWITKTAHFFEDPGMDQPLPTPRFDTNGIKSMEKEHTNGTTHSEFQSEQCRGSSHSSSQSQNSHNSAIRNPQSDRPGIELTTTFNPSELITIRDRAAKLSKETTDPYLKRSYCELAVAAHNLNSNLLCPNVLG